jgi:hypothetical protein
VPPGKAVPVLTELSTVTRIRKSQCKYSCTILEEASLTGRLTTATHRMDGTSVGPACPGFRTEHRSTKIPSWHHTMHTTTNKRKQTILQLRWLSRKYTRCLGMKEAPLKFSGYYMYHLLQHTETLTSVHMCVPYGSHSKQRLFPQTALTGCVHSGDVMCFPWGTDCICVFRMVLTINSDCFPKQH